MWTLVGIVAVLLLVSVWLTRVNDRYAKKAGGPGEPSESADELVETAWDDFGLSEDLELNRAAFGRLVQKAPPDALRRKSSVVALAIMAIRAERFELLAPLAVRAEAIEGGCGETSALGVLAAAYAGDTARAHALYVQSQRAISGCASCGSSGDGKILMQEVAIALRALEDGAVDGDARSDGKRTGRGLREAAARARGDSPKRSGDAELTAPDAALARADAWVDREGDSADAWASKGIALARMGALEVAERAFERALSLDAQCFTAHLGLAALIEGGDAHVSARILAQGRAALADTRLAATLGDLVDGFAALSEREQCNLAAAAGDLARHLEALAETGTRITVVLPHVRAADLGLTAGGLHELVLLGPEVFDDEGVFVSEKRAIVRWDALFGLGAEELSMPRAIAAMSWAVLPEGERAQLAAQVTREGRDRSPQAIADAMGDWHEGRIHAAITGQPEAAQPAPASRAEVAEAAESADA